MTTPSILAAIGAIGLFLDILGVLILAWTAIRPDASFRKIRERAKQRVRDGTGEGAFTVEEVGFLPSSNQIVKDTKRAMIGVIVVFFGFVLQLIGAILSAAYQS